jgi:hypothetical protein
MANLIRNKLMTDDQRKLYGFVEVDEISVDGKPKRGRHPWELREGVPAPAAGIPQRVHMAL